MKQAQETWKPIKENTNYEISNLGHIRHKDRPNQHLKPMPSNKNMIKLSKDGVVKFYNIAKLVLLTFMNVTPSNNESIKHIDKNKGNNRLENLQITKGWYPTAKKVRCLNDGKIFDRALDAAKYYNISNKGKITNVCLHRTKKCQGYVFEYVD